MSAYAISLQVGSLRQCEILENVVELRVVLDSLRGEGGVPEFDERVHPLAVIVSQDCDLTWDYQARTAADDVRPSLANKLLPNTLLCELFEATDLRGMQALNGPIWRRIERNQDERYHFLQRCDGQRDLAGVGFPELAIDFKRLFTIPTEELYYRISAGEIRRRSVLSGPFLQDLSNRFGYYHLRVALPDPVPDGIPALIAPPAIPALPEPIVPPAIPE